MLAKLSITLLVRITLSILESAKWLNNAVMSVGIEPALATSYSHYRKLCFTKSPKGYSDPLRVRKKMRNVKATSENGTAAERDYDSSCNRELPDDPTAGNPRLDPWKADMADIPGAWRIFYPLSLRDAIGLSPNPSMRPSMLFCDISGSVTGPEHEDSGQGSFILDAKESVNIDDGETFVHNRKIAMVILSGKTYSNIRLALLGRIFYSKSYVLNELDGTVKMRAAMIVGQAFVESYRSRELAETLERIKRRITVLDKQGNEVDPMTWEYQPLNSPGSPFRWMHGTDKWKLLGPFVAYRSLGVKIGVPHAPMMLDKYNDADIYNIVDPLKLNKTNFTKPELIEEETLRVVDAIFNPETNSEFCLKDREYVDQFYQEMVNLAKTGPGLYKGSME